MTFFAKRSILDILQGSEYASGIFLLILKRKILTENSVFESVLRSKKNIGFRDFTLFSIGSSVDSYSVTTFGLKTELSGTVLFHCSINQFHLTSQYTMICYCLYFSWFYIHLCKRN